jgi:hypothetical protein
VEVLRPVTLTVWVVREGHLYMVVVEALRETFKVLKAVLEARMVVGVAA